MSKIQFQKYTKCFSNKRKKASLDVKKENNTENNVSQNMKTFYISNHKKNIENNFKKKINNIWLNFEFLSSLSLDFNLISNQNHRIF